MPQISQGLVRRNAEKLLRETLSDTPVAVIQGARQTGKSTLIEMISRDMDIKYISLDDPAALTVAKSDPVGFVDQYPEGTLAIDELQRCPELLQAIKLSVDKNRCPARFILTGSADLLHLSGANESLAGRAETIKIWPFSKGELEGYEESFVTSLLAMQTMEFLKTAMPYSRELYADLASVGGYPEVIYRDQKRRNAFFRNYANGIMDHDAIEVSGLAHLDKLWTLWSLLSAQTSEELNVLDLSAKVQIPKSSLHAYVRLLKDLYLIHELPAWGKNLSNRVIARRKISINDSGLACYFNGINQAALHDVMNGEIFGPILESYIVSELVKQQTWSDMEYSLFHFRNRDNKEVDIVIELRDGRIIGLEVKAAKSVSQKDFQGMKALRDLAGERFLCGIVLYSGEEVFPYGSDMFLAPISSIWAKQ